MGELSLNPQNVTKEVWYYEEPRGICVVIQKRNPKGQLVSSAMEYLPWPKVARSVDRWRREKQRLAKKRAAKR